MSQQNNPAGRSVAIDWSWIESELCVHNWRAIQHWQQRLRDLTNLVLDDVERGELTPTTQHYARELYQVVSGLGQRR